MTLTAEELLENLVGCFDTSAAIYTYTGEDGTEVEVDEDTGLILEQAIQLLYSGESVFDSGGGDEVDEWN
jgi:hypothetical protein